MGIKLQYEDDNCTKWIENCSVGLKTDKERAKTVSCARELSQKLRHPPPSSPPPQVRQKSERLERKESITHPLTHSFTHSSTSWTLRIVTCVALAIVCWTSAERLPCCRKKPNMQARHHQYLGGRRQLVHTHTNKQTKRACF